MDDGCGRLRIPMVQYRLVPTQPELEIPSITISVSGASKKIFYTLTIKSHFQGRFIAMLKCITNTSDCSIRDYRSL